MKRGEQNYIFELLTIALVCFALGIAIGETFGGTTIGKD